MVTPSRRMQQAMITAQREAASRDGAAARAELEAERDRPLTPAEHQRRYRARQRGETVEPRKPGPKSRADRQRAALLEAQARITELEAELEELRGQLERQRAPRKLRQA
jgi:hypothetical protein